MLVPARDEGYECDFNDRRCRAEAHNVEIFLQVRLDEGNIADNTTVDFVDLCEEHKKMLFDCLREALAKFLAKRRKPRRPREQVATEEPAQ